LTKSPLKAWITKHGLASLKRYEELEKSSFRRPILLHAESPLNKFAAYIDVDSKFNETDKLSMIHTLTQMENVTTYDFMRDHVRDGRTHIHAFWFDIYTGEIYCFSRRKKCFLPIVEDNVHIFLDELDSNTRDSLDEASARDILTQARSHMEQHSH